MSNNTVKQITTLSHFFFVRVASGRRANMCWNIEHCIIMKSDSVHRNKRKKTPKLLLFGIQNEREGEKEREKPYHSLHSSNLRIGLGDGAFSYLLISTQSEIPMNSFIYISCFSSLFSVFFFCFAFCILLFTWISHVPLNIILLNTQIELIESCLLFRKNERENSSSWFTSMFQRLVLHVDKSVIHICIAHQIFPFQFSWIILSLFHFFRPYIFFCLLLLVMLPFPISAMWAFLSVCVCSCVRIVFVVRRDEMFNFHFVCFFFLPPCYQ